MHGALSAPGVYLHHAESLPPLSGTAVTGFVGVPQRGPVNVPQPISGWSEYAETFGGLVPFGHLAESVFGFFQNGGEKCWVVRAADTSRIAVVTPAGQCAHLLPLSAASRVDLDHASAQTIRFSALDPGEWGNALSVRVSTSSRWIRAGTLTTATVAASKDLALDAVVDLRPAAAIRITEPDGVHGTVERIIDTVTLATRTARATQNIGWVFPVGSVVYTRGFRIVAEFLGRREVFDGLSMRPEHPRHFASLVNAPTTMHDYGARRRHGFSSLVQAERVLPGGVARFRPADSTTALLLAGGSDTHTQARAAFMGTTGAILTVVAARERGVAGNGLLVEALPFATRLALRAPNGATTIVVEDARGIVAPQQFRLDDGTTVSTRAATAVNAGTNTITLGAALATAYGVGTTVAGVDRFTLATRREGERMPREVVRNVNGTIADPRSVRAVMAALPAGLLCANEPASGFTTPAAAGVTDLEVELGGGSGPGVMDDRYYTGYLASGSKFHPPELAPGTVIGLAALEDIEEIGLVSIPDLTQLAEPALASAQAAVLHHCATTGDRLALLDTPRDADATAIDQWASALRTSPHRHLAAAFHPWVDGRFEGMERLVPPTGLVAGVIARTDARLGVARAPANEQVKGAFGLVPAIERERHGALNQLGVNCIVKLEDGDVRLMGARTLSDDGASRYLSVRRTILTLRKALAQRMLWAVFEPASDALLRQITDSLTAHLDGLVARGVTASGRAADAYYVRCDASTNPPEQRALGIVVAEIGIALVAPAEFIVFTARRTPNAVQLIEEET